MQHLTLLAPSCYSRLEVQKWDINRYGWCVCNTEMCSCLKINISFLVQFKTWWKKAGYSRKNSMNFKWKYITFSHHFPIYSAAWIWIVLPQTGYAEVPAFAGLMNSYVGHFKKNPKNQTTTKKPQKTNNPLNHISSPWVSLRTEL